MSTLEEAGPSSIPEDDSAQTRLISGQHRSSSLAKSQVGIWFWVLAAAAGVSLLFSIIALGLAASTRSSTGTSTTTGPTASSSSSSSQPLISRVAFGSCSSYDLRPLNIFEEGIKPAQPDSFIWVGDIAYLDLPPVECAIAPELCQCNLTFIKSNPSMCHAGDFDHARGRMAHQLNSPQYRAFLQYMCPGAEAAGLFPPPGHDPSVCPKPILGVYDDHDYGWNNGNKRLPHKDRYKNLFLDAIGEAAGSPRRNANRGLYTSHVFNQGQAGREIQVVLLDERYEREPLPCQMRRASCQSRVSGPSADPWCVDFLVNDGDTGSGSCCFKDEQLAAWCSQAGSQSHALYTAVCDPANSAFGTKPVALNTSSPGVVNSSTATLAGTTWQLIDAGSPEWHSAQQESKLWRWLVQDSSLCEVLGPTQRQWLRQQLGLSPDSASTASQPSSSQSGPALRLIVSGSVPFGSLGYGSTADGSACSGDDLMCYRPAQVNLLHTLGNATGSGCVILLTGDFHYADIKAVHPGADHAYSSMLDTSRLGRPVYQVMSSGMSDSTAKGSGVCEGSYKEDLVGLRPAGRCAYSSHPNFGMINVDWEQQLVHLEIRDAAGGGVAKALGTGTELKLTLSLKTCQPV